MMSHLRKILAVLCVCVAVTIGAAVPAQAQPAVPVGPANCWNIIDVYFVDFADGDEYPYRVDNRTGGYIQFSVYTKDFAEVFSWRLHSGWLGPYGTWNRTEFGDFSREAFWVWVRYGDTAYRCDFGYNGFYDGPY